MSEVRPAGFWIRAVALAVDVVIVVLAHVSLRLVARLVGGVAAEESARLISMTSSFTLLFAAVYATVLHAATGQTIGKMVAGVQVVLVGGEPVPLGTSLLRVFGHAVSWLTLGLGYLMAGLRADKRALHDLIAGTRVERHRAEPAPVADEPSPASSVPMADREVPSGLS